MKKKSTIFWEWDENYLNKRNKKNRKIKIKHAKKTKLLVNYNRFNDKPSEKMSKERERDKKNQALQARIRRKSDSW